MNKKKKDPIKSMIKLVVTLIVITVGLITLVFNVSKGNLPSLEFGSDKKNTSTNKPVPSELNWFDTFKGIDNMKNKEKEEAEKKKLF